MHPCQALMIADVLSSLRHCFKWRHRGQFQDFSESIEVRLHEDSETRACTCAVRAQMHTVVDVFVLILHTQSITSVHVTVYLGGGLARSDSNARNAILSLRAFP